MRVVDAFDVHNVVEAVRLPIPLIGDLARAVRGKCIPMEPRQVADVDNVLDVVEPARLHRLLQDLFDTIVPAQDVIERQQRRRFRSHVGEDEPAAFLRAIARQTHFFFERTAVGFGRLLEAYAAVAEITPAPP